MRERGGTFHWYGLKLTGRDSVLSGGVKMRRHFFAFFVISLLSELGTTLLQKQRTTSDVYPGLYYPNFNALLAERLSFWFVIFVLLSGAWFLISRRVQSHSSGS